jgi:hypothetical protein
MGHDGLDRFEEPLMNRSVRFVCAAAALASLTMTGCTDAAGLLMQVPGALGSGLSIRMEADPSSTTVTAGQAVTLSVIATNPSGGALTYSWSATGGSLSSTGGSTVRWTAPGAGGSYTVNVSVSNGKDSAPGAYRFTVR